MTRRSALRVALGYVAAHDWRVFPCHWCGEHRKRPLIKGGLNNATRDPQVITEWFVRWPEALIGVPTGHLAGFVVLDVDVKHERANGYDSLEGLGVSILPETPMAHTTSGGLHLYFSPPDGMKIRNTAGNRGRGVGPGLDWRGDGGYIIAPSPGSGYEWDPSWNFRTVPLATVPHTLLPGTPEPIDAQKPVRPTIGLSPYAEAALDRACRKIISAPAGVQEITLHGECFSMGTLAGAGGIPIDFAVRTLLWAARQIPNHDASRPWRDADLVRKVERAFTEGMRHPRQALRA
jgi:putative DNA primase/helicase